MYTYLIKEIINDEILNDIDKNNIKMIKIKVKR